MDPSCRKSALSGHEMHVANTTILKHVYHMQNYVIMTMGDYTE